MVTKKDKNSLGRKLRDDLVVKPSDKPKFRSAMMSTIEHCEEGKALTREKFLRALIEKTQQWCIENGIPPVKDKLGTWSIKKVPNEVLSALTAEELKMYVSIYKDFVKSQLDAIKILDPFDTTKSAAAVKAQAKKPKKTFEELIASVRTGSDDS